MANVWNGNTWKVDTTSSSGAATSYLKKRNVKVLSLTVRVDATTDTVKIYDLNKTAYDSSPSYALGDLKFDWLFATAKDEYFFDFSRAPVVFPNGIWVAISGADNITFVIDSGSGV